MIQPSEEILDLVNESNEVIGQLSRNEIYARGLSNFRVINAFIVNDAGKLWIPRRTATKRMFPLCLDTGVGGHVESGEDYEYSFRRETQEETGIDIDKVKWKELGEMTPRDGVSAFMKVYAIYTNEVPNFNPEDFTEYYWLAPEELLKRLDDGDIAKDDLPLIVKKFYF